MSMKNAAGVFPVAGTKSNVLDVLKLHPNQANKYILLFGDVKDKMDKTIVKKVYDINGVVSATNYLQIPNPSGSIKTLGITSRYLYILMCPKPSKFFVTHVDVTCGTTAYRLSFSNLFKSKKLMTHSCQLPVTLSPRWSIIVVDIYAALQVAQQNFNSFSIRSIQLCANQFVRGVFASSYLHTPETFPRPSQYPIRSKSYSEHYNYVVIPSDKDCISVMNYDAPLQCVAPLEYEEDSSPIRAVSSHVAPSNSISSHQPPAHHTSSFPPPIPTLPTKLTTSVSSQPLLPSLPSFQPNAKKHIQHLPNVLTLHKMIAISKAAANRKRFCSWVGDNLLPRILIAYGSNLILMEKAKPLPREKKAQTLIHSPCQRLSPMREGSQFLAEFERSHAGTPRTILTPTRKHFFFNGESQGGDKNFSTSRDSTPKVTMGGDTATNDDRSQCALGDNDQIESALWAETCVVAHKGVIEGLCISPDRSVFASLHADKKRSMALVVWGIESLWEVKEEWRIDMGLPENSEAKDSPQSHPDGRQRSGAPHFQYPELIPGPSNDNISQFKDYPKNAFSRTDEIKSIPSNAQRGIQLSNKKESDFTEDGLGSLEKDGARKIIENKKASLKARVRGQDSMREETSTIPYTSEHKEEGVWTQSSDYSVIKRLSIVKEVPIISYIAMDIDIEKKRIAVCGKNEKNQMIIFVYSIEKKVGALIGRQMSDISINTLRWIPWETYGLLSCGRGNVRLWKMKNGMLTHSSLRLKTLESDSKIEYVDFDFSNEEVEKGEDEMRLAKKKVLLGDNKGSVCVLDYDALEVMGSYEMHEGKVLCVKNTSGFVVTSSEDKYICVVPKDMKRVYFMVQHDVVPIVVDDNDRYYGEAGRICILSGTVDGSVGLLHIGSQIYVSLKHSFIDKILLFCVCPNDNILITIAKDKYIRVWNMLTLTLSHEFIAVDNDITCIDYCSYTKHFVYSLASGLLRVVNLSQLCTVAEGHCNIEDLNYVMYFQVQKSGNTCLNLCLAASSKNGNFKVFDADNQYALVYQTSAAIPINLPDTCKPFATTSKHIRRHQMLLKYCNKHTIAILGTDNTYASQYSISIAPSKNANYSAFITHYGYIEDETGIYILSSDNILRTYFIGDGQTSLTPIPIMETKIVSLSPIINVSVSTVAPIDHLLSQQLPSSMLHSLQALKKKANTPTNNDFWNNSNHSVVVYSDANNAFFVAQVNQHCMQFIFQPTFQSAKVIQSGYRDLPTPRAAGTYQRISNTGPLGGDANRTLNTNGEEPVRNEVFTPSFINSAIMAMTNSIFSPISQSYCGHTTPVLSFGCTENYLVTISGQDILVWSKEGCGVEPLGSGRQPLLAKDYDSANSSPKFGEENVNNSSILEKTFSKNQKELSLCVQDDTLFSFSKPSRICSRPNEISFHKDDAFFRTEDWRKDREYKKDNDGETNWDEREKEKHKREYDNNSSMLVLPLLPSNNNSSPNIPCEPYLPHIDEEIYDFETEKIKLHHCDEKLPEISEVSCLDDSLSPVNDDRIEVDEQSKITQEVKIELSLMQQIGCCTSSCIDGGITWHSSLGLFSYLITPSWLCIETIPPKTTGHCRKRKKHIIQSTTIKHLEASSICAYTLHHLQNATIVAIVHESSSSVSEESPEEVNHSFSLRTLGDDDNVLVYPLTNMKVPKDKRSEEKVQLIFLQENLVLLGRMGADFYECELFFLVDFFDLKNRKIIRSNQFQLQTFGKFISIQGNYRGEFVTMEKRGLVFWKVITEYEETLRYCPSDKAHESNILYQWAKLPNSMLCDETATFVSGVSQIIGMNGQSPYNRGLWESKGMSRRYEGEVLSLLLIGSSHGQLFGYDYDENVLLFEIHFSMSVPISPISYCGETGKFFFGLDKGILSIDLQPMCQEGLMNRKERTNNVVSALSNDDEDEEITPLVYDSQVTDNDYILTLDAPINSIVLSSSSEEGFAATTNNCLWYLNCAQKISTRLYYSHQYPITSIASSYDAPFLYLPLYSVSTSNHTDSSSVRHAVTAHDRNASSNDRASVYNDNQQTRNCVPTDRQSSHEGLPYKSLNVDKTPRPLGDKGNSGANERLSHIGERTLHSSRVQGLSQWKERHDKQCDLKFWFATAASDSTIKVWNEEPNGSIQPTGAFAISSTCTSVVFITSALLASSFMDGHIRLFDCTKMKQIGKYLFTNKNHALDMKSITSNALLMILDNGQICTLTFTITKASVNEEASIHLINRMAERKEEPFLAQSPLTITQYELQYHRFIDQDTEEPSRDPNFVSSSASSNISEIVESIDVFTTNKNVACNEGAYRTIYSYCNSNRYISNNTISNTIVPLVSNYAVISKNLSGLFELFSIRYSHHYLHQSKTHCNRCRSSNTSQAHAQGEKLIIESTTVVLLPSPGDASACFFESEEGTFLVASRGSHFVVINCQSRTVRASVSLNDIFTGGVHCPNSITCYSLTTFPHIIRGMNTKGWDYIVRRNFGTSDIMIVTDTGVVLMFDVLQLKVRSILYNVYDTMGDMQWESDDRSNRKLLPPPNWEKAEGRSKYLLCGSGMNDMLVVAQGINLFTLGWNNVEGRDFR